MSDKYIKAEEALKICTEMAINAGIEYKKLEAERDALKHELEEALQEISGLKQCDCIVRGAE